MMSANVADFELRLKDSVTGPAKQAADAMRRFEAQAVKAQLAAQRAAERAATTQRREAERVENAWKKMAATQEQETRRRESAIRKLGVAQAQAAAINNRLEMQAAKSRERLQTKAAAEAAKEVARKERETRRLGLAQAAALKLNEKFNADHMQSFGNGSGGGHGFLGAFGKALPFRSIGDYAQGAFWGDLAAKGVEKAADIFIEGVRKAVDFFKDGLQAIGAEQQRQAGYRLTLGSSAGAQARSDVEKFKGLTAFSGSQNQDLMLPLYRAGLKGQEARNAYAAALDLAAGQGKGADQGAVASAVDTFAQIQRKGGVTSKQLAGIGLGETNLPAFYKSLGGMLGADAKTAETRAAQPGGVDPQLLRNVIYDAIEKQQGGKLGSGGKDAASSLFAQWNKLKELPMDFFEGLANSPGLKKIGDATKGFLEKLDPDGPIGKRIFAGLTNAFEFLSQRVAAAFEYLSSDEFAAGFGKAIDFGKTLGATFLDVFKIGKDIFDILGDLGVLKVLGAVVKGVEWVTNKLEIMLAAIERAAETLRRGIGSVIGDELKGRSASPMPNISADDIRGLPPARPVATNPSTGGKSVNVHVNVDASGHDEDADGAHRRAARKVARHIGTELERAAAEGGA